MQTVFALVFVSLISYSYALECYTCISLNDKGCTDPFTSNKTKVECAVTLNACYKFTASHDEQTVVTRSCGVSVGENKCQEYGMGGTSGILCVCSGEKCNGASHVIAGPVGFVVTSIVAIYYLLFA